MVPKHQTLKLFSHSISQKTLKNKTLYYFLSNPLCTTTESPDLPSWLNQTPTTTTDSDEDFVIPSLANWVENHSRVVKHLLAEEQQETNTDMDNISKILKNRYPSSDNVVQALNGSFFNASNSLVSQLLKRFSNDWVPAFGVFIWAKTQTGYVHSPELYNTMVDVLGKCKKFDLMWDLVNEMNELEGYVTLATMSKVIRRLAKAGRYSDAIDAFKGLDQFGVSKDVMALNIIMDALTKADSVEHAYQVFVEFKDSIPVSTRIFNVLIHGFCKARKLDDAKKIMDQMEVYGFRPDVVSYTCFIESYCREKDFRKVDAIFDEMQEKGCTPNAVTYTIVMHAYGKARQINEALEVYEKMKRNGCVPDTSFYSSLIFILSKSGRLKDANEIFEDMEKQGLKPDVLTYNTMISNACAHSLEETALKLLQKMEEDSCKPDLKTYAPLLKMCCRKKRMKVLNFLLSHMFKNDVSIDLGTYSLLVCGLCKSGKLEQACLFFEEMVLKGMVPEDSTYKILVEELEKKSMAKAKEQIEKLMLKAQERERN